MYYYIIIYINNYISIDLLKYTFLYICKYINIYLYIVRIYIYILSYFYIFDFI